MKTALITGIGKGIGRALAEKFLNEGFFVIGTYLNTKPDLEHSNLTVLPLDLRSSESIEECVKQIESLGKKIDILINNAGALLDDEETSVVVDKLRATLEVNLIGPISLTEKLIPLMNAGGHIVNVSSSAGSLNLPAVHDHWPNHYPAYKISKTALNMYTRSLSARLMEQNIIVSSVHPGWVSTDMGGEGADLTPAEAAEHIFRLANSQVETGQFWFKGEKFPW